MVYLIFSKDRPLQLELTLSTCKRFSIDWSDDHAIVLYKTTNDKYQKAYDELEKRFPDIEFIKQYNFMNDVLNILYATEYILFSVDDCIFTDYFSTKEIIKTIEKYNTIGFSLRLGENTTYCYPLYKNNDVPNFKYINESILIYDCRPNKFGDYYYPLEVSSSVFLAKDITKVLQNYAFSNPNLLEGILHTNRHKLDYKNNLSCYKKSVAFCNPINLVQTVSNSARRGNNIDYTPESLLRKYLSGIKINESLFYGFISNGCHQEVELKFIERY